MNPPAVPTTGLCELTLEACDLRELEAFYTRKAVPRRPKAAGARRRSIRLMSIDPPLSTMDGTRSFDAWRWRAW
jgi:hypothetical protein